MTAARQPPTVPFPAGAGPADLDARQEDRDWLRRGRPGGSAGEEPDVGGDDGIETVGVGFGDVPA